MERGSYVDITFKIEKDSEAYKLLGNLIFHTVVSRERLEELLGYSPGSRNFSVGAAGLEKAFKDGEEGAAIDKALDAYKKLP